MDGYLEGRLYVEARRGIRYIPIPQPKKREKVKRGEATYAF